MCRDGCDTGMVVVCVGCSDGCDVFKDVWDMCVCVYRNGCDMCRDGCDGNICDACGVRMIVMCVW